MSIDDVQEEIRAFTTTLEQLNENVEKSTSELDAIKDSLSSLWDDSMRQEFESQFEPLETKLKEYIQSTRGDYMELLQSKEHSFGGYLNEG